jgi:YfiH family protein
MKNISVTKRPAANRSQQTLAASGKQWSTLRAGGLEILQAKAMRTIPWVVHGFSMRGGGGSLLNGERILNLGFLDWDKRKSVENNRAKFIAALDAEEMNLAPLRQFHSDLIHFFQKPAQQAPRADAGITRAPGILLAVHTADCVPILLVDRQRRAIAAIHAGWRGTLKRIVMKTLGRMQMALGTESRDVVAAIGPAIGACCYEVGPEVAQAFAGQFGTARDWFDGPFDQLAAGDTPNPLQWLTMVPPGHQPPAPRVNLNLHAANRWQLLEAGIAPENIFVSDLCTSCRSDLLFSYRREGSRSGRMLAVVGIRPTDN